MTNLELFTTLSDISTEALAGMEELQMEDASPKPRRRPVTRGLLFAAVVAILLLLSGCCLYVITRNLNWSKELEQDLQSYNEATDIGILSKNWMLDEAAIELSAAPPVDGTLEITCQEWGLNAEGTLHIGREYWIEKWNGKTYGEIPTLDKTPWILPEQQVTCGTQSSWTVDYQEKYGELEPGNYRIGLMVSKAGQDGEDASLGCFAKFRVQETNLVPYLEQFNEAFLALKNADAYHIYRTEFVNNVVPSDYDAHRDEIWKCGNDFAECVVVKELNAEAFNSFGSGQMLRDGVGYGVKWPEGKITGQPGNWNRLDFVEGSFFELWSTFFDSAYQKAVDVQSFDGQLNIVTASDLMDHKEYGEIQAFFDSEGNLQRLEYAQIPGLTYDEEDRVLWTAVDVIPTSSEEAAKLIQSIDVTNPASFSFEEDQQQWEANGYTVKTEGFHSTAAQSHMDMDTAVRLANAEVASKENITTVYYDPDAQIWKVVFTYSQDDSVYYAVYLDNAGITQQIVSK